jgi:hypothetical protein
MKKSVLTTLLVTVCAFAFAQKGSVLLNGSLYFSSQKDGIGGNNNKTSVFSFSPGIGYQIADQWTLGLDLGYQRTSYSYVANQYSIGPYVRYTKQLNSLISVYGQFEASYWRAHSSGVSNTYGSRFIGLNAFPAVELNLGKGFGLNFNFGGLSYYVTKVDGASGSDGVFNFSLGSSVGFGLSKRFGTTK